VHRGVGGGDQGREGGREEGRKGGTSCVACGSCLPCHPPLTSSPPPSPTPPSHSGADALPHVFSRASASERCRQGQKRPAHGLRPSRGTPSLPPSLPLSLSTWLPPFVLPLCSSIRFLSF
jgi:hypothetical protein